MPEANRTEELTDLVEWLGELVRQVDSSLLDEWEQLAAPGDEPAAIVRDATPPRLSTNHRAFTVLVRNAMFRRIELAAHQRWTDLEGLDSDPEWTAARWRESFEAYFAEYPSIGVGADARSSAMLMVDRQPERWLVRQIVDDPEGDHGWAITAEVDLDASDAEGTAVLRVTGVTGD